MSAAGSRSSGWVAAGVAVGVLLHVAAAWWAPPGWAQGSTNTTFTTSTTHHTTIVACPPNTAHVETSVTTTTTIGPATILIGEDQSQTFFVAAGTLNINTNTHTETFVCAAAVPALPAVGAVAAALLLGGLAAWRLRRPPRYRMARGP